MSSVVKVRLTVSFVVLLLAAVLGVTGHIVGAVLLVVLVIGSRLGWAALVPARRLPKDRIRRLRVRLACRVHPGRGFVTTFGIHRRFSGRAMVRRDGTRIRPSMTKRQMRQDPDSVSFTVGRAHWRLPVRLPLNRHLVVVAPPRQGKTGHLGDVVLNYPGPVLCTSTRTDLFEATSGVRQKSGPVETYNPQGIGHTPSTIRTNPVRGCVHEQTAIRKAIAFTDACSGGGTEDRGFWEQQARASLAGLLCAADIVSADLRLVLAWGLGYPAQAVAILEAAGKQSMALGLYEFAFSPADKTTSTIRMVLKEALGFLLDPELAACCLPATDADAFNFEQAIRDNTTLYLIGESDGESAPVAPLFAYMAAEWKYAATQIGSRMEGGKLDPPTLMALDEVAAICPLPLPQMVQDSGGRGIEIITIVHGLAQLRGRWGENGQQTVLDTSALLALPGVKDPQLLKMMSELCGDVLLTERDDDGRNHHFPVMTPDMIRSLPDFHGLLIADAERPVLVRLPMSWDAKAYKDAVKAGTAVAAVETPRSVSALDLDGAAWGELMESATRQLPESAKSKLSEAIRAMQPDQTRTFDVTVSGGAAANFEEQMADRGPRARLRRAYGPKCNGATITADGPPEPVSAELDSLPADDTETVIESDGEVEE